jgi:hypothetical protein
MSIALAEGAPEREARGSRANFRWRLEEPWDERRLAAFLMTKHRRDDADWTRRPSPFVASLGQVWVECSVPVVSDGSLPELETILTRELAGIIAGAARVYEEMLGKGDWRRVSPP